MTNNTWKHAAKKHKARKEYASHLAWMAVGIAAVIIGFEVVDVIEQNAAQNVLFMGGY